MNVEEQLTHTIEAYKKRNQKVLEDEERVDLNDVSQELDEFDKKLKVEKKHQASQSKSRILEASEGSEDMENLKPVKADFKKPKAQSKPQAQPVASSKKVASGAGSQQPSLPNPMCSLGIDSSSQSKDRKCQHTGKVT